jgi:hypothetical protein
MKFIYIILIIVIVAVSCNDEQKSKNIIFDNVEKLHAELIPIQNIFDPLYITLSNGILIFTSYRSSPMLHFYETPSLKYLYSTGIRGGGPDDIREYPRICQNTSSDILYIHGYTPTTIKGFVVYKDSMVLVKTYTLGDYEVFNDHHIIQDSIFIYSRVNRDLSVKKYDLNANYEIGKFTLKMASHGEPFFSKNYGYFAANDSIIVHVYNYRKQIDLYDAKSLKLEKQIIDKYKSKYKEISFEYNENVLQYIGVVAGKKYFYALYRDGYNNIESLNNDIIEVFDYAGNPIVKYVFEDITPQIFAIDENNHTIYGYSYKLQDYLLKYTVPF